MKKQLLLASLFSLTFVGNIMGMKRKRDEDEHQKETPTGSDSTQNLYNLDDLDFLGMPQIEALLPMTETSEQNSLGASSNTNKPTRCYVAFQPDSSAPAPFVSPSLISIESEATIEQLLTEIQQIKKDKYLRFHSFATYTHRLVNRNLLANSNLSEEPVNIKDCLLDTVESKNKPDHKLTISASADPSLQTFKAQVLLTNTKFPQKSFLITSLLVR